MRRRSQHSGSLARTVAADLTRYGWRLERVMTDNASEFRSATSGQAISILGDRHTVIRAGRTQTMHVDYGLSLSEWGA